jgi:uncharacterized membrane protein
MVGIATEAYSQHPFFMGLGNLGTPGFGTPHSVAWDISADGTVVVGESGSPRLVGGGSEAFRWTRESGMIGLGPVASLNHPIVSADGSTAMVKSATCRNGVCTDHYFRWTSSAGLIPVPVFGGVSVDGSILVGSAIDPTTGRAQAARWTEVGGVEFLPFTDFENSGASDISADGSVILGYAPSFGDVIWTATDGVVPLELPIPNSQTILSHDGKVIVGIVGNEVTANRRGFRWTMQTGPVELGHLPDGRLMSALGVSADGSVVVGNSQNNGQGAVSNPAAIWDSIHGPRYLGDILINELGLGGALAGWSQLTAKGVSGDGRSVIGDGRNPDGIFEAWIAYLGPATLPGDFNTNGTVDAADYIVWRNGLGTTYTQADYNTWRANFGRSAVAAATVAVGNSIPAVPEPTAASLLLIGPALMLAWRLRDVSGHLEGAHRRRAARVAN